MKPPQPIPLHKKEYLPSFMGMPDDFPFYRIIGIFIKFWLKKIIGSKNDVLYRYYRFQVFYENKCFSLCEAMQVAFSHRKTDFAYPFDIIDEKGKIYDRQDIENYWKEQNWI